MTACGPRRPFLDDYARGAVAYARYRPHYPASLFRYLATLCPHRGRVLDCGSGTAQAAGQLTAFFEHVLATDPSLPQIRNAAKCHNLHSVVSRGEDCVFHPRTVNLIVVAQAIHLFDLERFYRTARKLAAPGCYLAVWCYNLSYVDRDVDTIVHRFYTDFMGPYWPPERRLVDACYRTLPFPFHELQSPRFEMEAHWRLPQLTGYLHTWSAVRRYRDRHATDPVAHITAQLEAAWGTPTTKRRVSWPLHLRVGLVA